MKIRSDRGSGRGKGSPCEDDAGRTPRKSSPVPAGLSEEEQVLLRYWCSLLELQVDPSTSDRLGLYRDQLLEWTTRMNLTSITDTREIFIKHFLDSLSVLPWLPRDELLLDVGTGAGFPGMVLKMARRALQVTLVEATGKKVGFLEHLRRVCGLENCEILHRRLSGGEMDLAGRFGVVVSRGVESPEEFVPWAARYLKVGGIVIAMAGRVRPVKRLEEFPFRRSTGCRLEDVRSLDLPERAGTRHLLLFVKEAEVVPRGT